MDIDIDTQFSVNITDIFNTAIRASMVKDGVLSPHQVGVYFQNIPIDKITKLSAIPYKEAEALGYFKIDFLHLSALDPFVSKDDMRALTKLPPDWNLLQIPSVVKKLIHVGDYYDLLDKIKPKSVQELADVLAIIRPGKRHLLDVYIQDRDNVRKELYQKPQDGKYYFKRSHAISYAMVIVLQLHLIKAGIL